MAAEHADIAQAFDAADAARVRTLVHDHVRGAGEDALERLPGHEDHTAEEIS
jgi:DNA-binding GntR family transcriptional regulator